MGFLRHWSRLYIASLNSSCVRHGRLIGIEGEFTTRVAESAIALSEAAYPNASTGSGIAELQREELAFSRLCTGEAARRNFVKAPQQISGIDAFILYDTFP